ncbi:hypothetical protein CK203_074811 [Vitis vinifera]|uniref:Uncharacterized protein n=1 Tax=Vitis vinifera TaxID=29760 RepID=A0A438DEE8_VITVI|nr:hypothetical protein CK203_074811 [Vitis vinifera]
MDSGTIVCAGKRTDTMPLIRTATFPRGVRIPYCFDYHPVGPLSFSSPENAPPIPSHQAFMLLASQGTRPMRCGFAARLCATDSPRMLHSGLHHPLRPTSTPAPVSLPGILLRDGRADRVRREARGHVKGMLARAVRHSAGGGSCHVEPVADRSGAVEHRIGGGVVALSVFVVGLPEWTHLMAKRIAFGQIVIVYVGASIIHEEGAGAFMHLLHVASSTALGALASVLALLLPYPRLASSEVNEIWKSYAENASERLNLFLEAFSAPDNSAALDSISQAKFFSERGDKLLQTIRLVEDGILWERPWTRFFKPHCFDPGDRLQAIEIPLRGMEIALSSFTSLPTAIADDELGDALQRVTLNTSLRLEQAKCSQPLASTTVPNSTGKVFRQTPSGP